MKSLKQTLALVSTLFLTSCLTTELVDSWKSPEIEVYNPTKVMIVGMTPNVKARTKFEQLMKNELELRGVEATMSLQLFDSTLRAEKMSQEEIKALENKLANEGFDTVLFTKVLGIEDKVAYKTNYYEYDKTYKKFKDDYLKFQDIYYNPEYYDEYQVFHAETSMYCICPTKDRELIWKGYIDILDINSIEKNIDDYVQLVFHMLEQENLIGKKVFTKKTQTDNMLNQ